MRTVGSGLDLVGRAGERAHAPIWWFPSVPVKAAPCGSRVKPGIGKSSLLAEVVAHTRRSGCQVLAGAAEESDGLFVMRGLLEALEVRPNSTDPARASLARLLWSVEPMASATPRDVAAIAAERSSIWLSGCVRRTRVAGHGRSAVGG